MKHKAIVLIAVLCAFVPCIYASLPDKAKTRNVIGAHPDAVLLTVAGKPVTLSEFGHAYLKQRSDSLESVDSFLERFILYKRKVADAEAMRLDTLQAFMDEFARYKKYYAERYVLDPSVLDSLVKAVYYRDVYDLDVSHIMLPTEPLSQQLVRADSIRRAIGEGADFSEMALRYSVDPTVAQNSGRLGWLPDNVYPREFVEAAYLLAEGGCSSPVITSHGIHIIKVNRREQSQGKVRGRLLSKMVDPSDAVEFQRIYDEFDAIRRQLEQGADFDSLAAIMQDGEKLYGDGRLDWFRRGTLLPDIENVILSMDSAQVSPVIRSPLGLHIFICDGHCRPMPYDAVKKDIANRLVDEGRAQAALDGGLMTLRRRYAPRLVPLDVNDTYAADSLIAEWIVDSLMYNEPEYATLVTEFYDGNMLYEASRIKVWENPADDKQALEAFFRQNEYKYKWNEPHFKGYIVFATDTSMVGDISRYLDGRKFTTNDSLAYELLSKFGREVTARYVVCEKGKSPVVDAIAFGAEPYVATDKWVGYLGFDWHIAFEPECAADAGSELMDDYQHELELKWRDELTKKYPVHVNKKILKMVK